MTLSAKKLISYLLISLTGIDMMVYVVFRCTIVCGRPTFSKGSIISHCRLIMFTVEFLLFGAVVGCMIVRFTIYNYLCTQCLSPLTFVSSNPAHGEVHSIQHHVIMFVSDLRQISVLLRFSPPIKLAATI